MPSVNRFIIAVALVGMFAGTSTGAATEYISKNGHCRFTVPDGWHQLPQPALREYIQAVEQLANNRFKGLEAAFVPSSEDAIAERPYVLLFVTPGRSSEAEFQKAANAQSFGDTLQNTAKSFRDLLTMNGQTTSFYDQKKHALFAWFTGNQGEVEFQAATVTMLGAASTVQFGFYSTAEQWNEDAKSYATFLDTFSFNSGFTYDSAGPISERTIAVFVVGALTLLSSGVAALKNRKRRRAETSEAPPESQQ